MYKKKLDCDYQEEYEYERTVSYLKKAIIDVDKIMGEGYAKQHPELINSIIVASSIHYTGYKIAKEISTPILFLNKNIEKITTIYKENLEDPNKFKLRNYLYYIIRNQFFHIKSEVNLSLKILYQLLEKRGYAPNIDILNDYLIADGYKLSKKKIQFKYYDKQEGVIFDNDYCFLFEPDDFLSPMEIKKIFPICY